MMSESTQILRNDAAFQELGSRIGHDDNESSSHWREMHQRLRVKNGVVIGAGGFGVWRKPYTGLRRLAHDALLSRYRRLGRNIHAFPLLDRLASEITRRQDRAYNLDVLRQSLSCAQLIDILPARVETTDPILIIGDGYGTLATMFLAATQQSRVILVNLSQTLLADFAGVKAAYPDFDVALVSDANTLDSALSDSKLRVIGIAASNYRLIEHLRVALAVNIASMQEMRIGTVRDYFDALRRSQQLPLPFYCCNRIEKTLPDGEVIRFSDYPWRPEDEIVFDELCPWHQTHYTSRPPFYVPYDGPIQHRLAWLAPA